MRAKGQKKHVKGCSSCGRNHDVLIFSDDEGLFFTCLGLRVDYAIKGLDNDGYFTSGGVRVNFDDAVFARL